MKQLRNQTEVRCALAAPGHPNNWACIPACQAEHTSTADVIFPGQRPDKARRENFVPGGMTLRRR